MPSEARRHVDLVEDVGLVGRDDRHAEHLAEAGGEDEQPDQRPHQRREEALALVQEAQHLAPDDAGKQADSRSGRGAGRVRQPVVAPGRGSASSRRSCRLRVRCRSCARKASLTFCVPGLSQQARAPCRVEQHASLVQDDDIVGRRRPRRQSASPTARRGPPRDERAHDAMTLSREPRSSPTVASSSSSSGGRWSSERAISTRRAWPPERCGPSRCRGRRGRRAQRLAIALARLAAADAVQRGVVEQVLAQRQIGVERAAWKTTPRRCSAAPGCGATSWPRMRISPRARCRRAG